MSPSLMPLNAAHARAIARANGAPRGERRKRGHALVLQVMAEMRRALGLKPVKLKRGEKP